MLFNMLVMHVKLLANVQEAALTPIVLVQAINAAMTVPDLNSAVTAFKFVNAVLPTALPILN